MGCQKLMGRFVILESLSDHLIPSYFEQFSSLIKSLLHVQDEQSEYNYLQARIEQNAFFYVIIKKDTEQLIGAMEIRDPGHASQLYCWINERYWGAGYFKESMQLLTDYYQKQTGYHALTACIDCTNVRSFYALKKIGFKKIGTRMGPFGNQHVIKIAF